MKCLSIGVILNIVCLINFSGWTMRDDHKENIIKLREKSDWTYKMVAESQNLKVDACRKFYDKYSVERE